MLTNYIAENIQKQLYPNPLVSNRGVEVVRTSAFTSSRKDSHPDGVRMRMVRDFQKNNFETHLYETMGLQEKCVDISLAVEMLYLATVPGLVPHEYDLLSSLNIFIAHLHYAS